MRYIIMTSYISDVTAITDTVTDLGTIIQGFGEAMPGPILALVIPFAMLGAIVGIIGLATAILPKVINKALGRV